MSKAARFTGIVALVALTAVGTLLIKALWTERVYRVTLVIPDDFRGRIPIHYSGKTEGPLLEEVTVRVTNGKILLPSDSPIFNEWTRVVSVRSQDGSVVKNAAFGESCADNEIAYRGNRSTSKGYFAVIGTKSDFLSIN